MDTDQAQCRSPSCIYQLGRDAEELWVRPKYGIPSVGGLTIPELCRQRMRNWKNRVAFECGITGKRITHEEVCRLSRGLAAGLMKIGFNRGDAVGIVLPNCSDYAIALFGIWEAGCVGSPINPSCTVAEMTQQLLSSGAKAVIASTDLVSTIESLKLSQPIAIIFVGEAASSPSAHKFSDLVNTDTTGIKLFGGCDIDTTKELCLLPYSSGTTGLPKAVMLTHKNLVINVVQAASALDRWSAYEGTQEEHQRVLAVIPFFHILGITCVILLAMFRGSSVVTLPKFEPKTFLEAIRKHRPTEMVLVPPLVTFLVSYENVVEGDLADLRRIIAAAAPFGESLIRQFRCKYGPRINFIEAYGMTETSPAVTCGLPEGRHKVGSCGELVPLTVAKIVDPKNGRALTRNERGELCIKGPQVTKGYLNNEEATRELIDRDGWLHTGDIAYFDDDDYLYIVDRLKELIKAKGFQVAPSELEDVLRGCHKIQDVAVIGVPHEIWGEAPRAYVVKHRDHANLSEEEVKTLVENKLSKYKHLHGGIEFVETIPKAASGKILRRQLLQAYKLSTKLE